MGRWQMVPTTGPAGLMFTAGKRVEVSFDRESLRDCWLPATILKNSENKDFLVEYQQPGSSDKEGPHKAIVDYLHMRPSPPHLRDQKFVLLEKVDAYYDFGWWSGVITKELADNRYNVFFKHTIRETEFENSRLRPHMEWKGGKWFNTSQGDTDGRTHFLIDEHIEQTTPSIDKQSTVAASIMMKTRQENLDSNDKGSPPSKKLQDEIMTDDLSKKINCPSVGQSEGSDSERSKLPKDSSRKRGRLSNELKSCQASEKGSNVDSIKTRTQEIVGEKDISEDLAFPVVMGLQGNGMPVSQGMILQKRSTEKSPKITGSNTQRRFLPRSYKMVAEKEGNEGDAVSVAPRRKRGRPPKLQGISPKAPVALNNQKGSVLSSAFSVVEGGQMKEVVSTTSLGAKSLKQNQGTVEEQPGIQNGASSKDKLPSENTGQDTKQYSKKKGNWRTISINTAPAQDSEDSSEGKTNGSLEKESATRNPEAAVVSDNQPPSRRPPITVHDPERTVGQSSMVSERHVTCDIDSEDLPLVRSTSLWKTIESMETFRMLPQKPHFRPLLKGAKESAREGLAIGAMVTFSTIADKTRDLRFADPRSWIEDCLETLVELENNGFDVKVIRARLTRLLLIKDKQEQRTEQSKRIVEKIEEHNVQVKRDDEEIEAIDRQMKELADKRKRVLLKKAEKDIEISLMKAMNGRIEQEMRGVGAEFDGLAAGPFVSI